MTERRTAKISTKEVRILAKSYVETLTKVGINPGRLLTDTVSGLCDEIDALRAEVEEWKARYEVADGEAKAAEAEIEQMKTTHSVDPDYLERAVRGLPPIEVTPNECPICNGAAPQFGWSAGEWLKMCAKHERACFTKSPTAKERGETDQPEEAETP